MTLRQQHHHLPGDVVLINGVGGGFDGCLARVVHVSQKSDKHAHTRHLCSADSGTQVGKKVVCMASELMPVESRRHWAKRHLGDILAAELYARDCMTPQESVMADPGGRGLYSGDNSCVDALKWSDLDRLDFDIGCEPPVDGIAETVAFAATSVSDAPQIVMLARSAERKREVDPSEYGYMFDVPKRKEVDKIVRKHAAVKHV